MSVSRKLVAGFAVVVVVFTALAAYHLTVIRESAHTSRELRRLSGRLEATSARHLRLLDRLEESASKYWVTRDSGYAARYATARDSFASVVRDLEGAGLTEREREPVARLVSTWAGGRALPRRLPDRLSAMAAGSATDSLQALRRRVGELRRRTRAVNRSARSAIRSRVDAAAEAEERAETVSWIALAAGLLMAGLVSWLVIRSILDGLGRLRAGTRAVADGDFGHRIRIDADDEFGELADAFNRMTVRLGEVDRLKREFLSQVSHDLKTPLASVQETARLLLDEVPGELNDDQRRLLEMALRSSERLSTMIARLLDLSRMEADAVTYELEPVELGELVREVADEFRPQLREPGIELEVAVRDGEGARAADGDGGADAPGSDGGPRAVVDRDRTVQVLQNLLENAREHSPDGGRIRVSVEERSAPPADMPRWAAERRPGSEGAGAPGIDAPGIDAPLPDAPGANTPDTDADHAPDSGRWILLSVADQGPGVDPEDRPAIFERFRQLDRGVERSAGGAGLGLTLCREIVEAHGGTIWVEESERGGSCFRALLPARPTGAPGATRSSGADDGVVDPVDDEPDASDRPPGDGRTAALSLAVLLSVTLAGCATLGLGADGPEARFHRLWEAGRYDSAAALFERDSTLHDDGRVLWRAALARLRPATVGDAAGGAGGAEGDAGAGADAGDGPEAGDARTAARTLERLLELEPVGERAVEARALLSTLRALGEVRTRLERLKAIDLGQPPDSAGGG